MKSQIPCRRTVVQIATTRLACCAVLFIAWAAAASSLAQPADTPWPTFKHDMCRTSQSINIGARTAAVKWACHIGSAMQGSSPAVGLDGTIYVGAEDGNLYAVSSDGVIKWSYTLSTGTYKYIRSTPSIGADGTIYVGQWDTHKVYALTDEGDHADLSWQSPDVGAVAFSSPAIGDDGTVYICGCGLTRGLSALDGNDGSLKWRFTTGSSPGAWNQGSPAIGPDGIIYFASEDSHVYAIYDAGDHYVLEWSYYVNLPHNQGISSPAVADDGTIYVGWVGWNEDNFFALNSDGTLKWALPFPNRVMSSPAIAYDGTIVVGCDDGKVYAIEDLGDHGEILWSYQTGSYVESSAAIDAEGKLYIGSYDDAVYCLDLATGDPIWSYTTGHNVLTSPAIGAWRTIYVSGWDGYLYAFGPDCPGDITGPDGEPDGFTDLSDLALLLSAYGKCPGDPGYVAEANLVENDPPDGCINLADLAYLLSDYGCGV